MILVSFELTVYLQFININTIIFDLQRRIMITVKENANKINVFLNLKIYAVGTGVVIFE